MMLTGMTCSLSYINPLHRQYRFVVINWLSPSLPLCFTLNHHYEVPASHTYYLGTSNSQYIRMCHVNHTVAAEAVLFPFLGDDLFYCKSYMSGFFHQGRIVAMTTKFPAFPTPERQMTSMVLHIQLSFVQTRVCHTQLSCIPVLDKDVNSCLSWRLWGVYASFF